MKYFLPDSRDHVDASFDFESERGMGQARFAHDLLGRVHDGVLVSLGTFRQGRYSARERARLLDEGAPSFFRASDLTLLGDCGAFSYVAEPAPPYTIDEVVEFYVRGRFDLGLSLDHVVLEYDASWDLALLDLVPTSARERQALTLELAGEFLAAARGCGFKPIGVAQGWSPASYAAAVAQLQRIGYRYVALGGIVPLDTADLLEVVRAVADVRAPGVGIHLLGVSRLGHVAELGRLGVVSFDSTSPLRRAWLDTRHNYFLADASFMALRVPDVARSPKIRTKIAAGQLDETKAREAEHHAMTALRRLDADATRPEPVLDALLAFQDLHDEVDRREEYRRVLDERPWLRCRCEVCRSAGIHVMLMRGAERSRRRGFHNVGVFYRRLQRELAQARAE